MARPPLAQRFFSVVVTGGAQMKRHRRRRGPGKAQDQLEASLLAGLQSDVTELTAADWRAIRQEALAKVKARQSGR